jgi:hypothetical protein
VPDGATKWRAVEVDGEGEGGLFDVTDIVFRKRESVRTSKHCRYDVPTERKFRPTFDDEKDENEKYH